MWNDDKLKFFLIWKNFAFEESYFKTQYLQKYVNGVNTWF